MPPGPTQTANWSRGKKGWFTERYISRIYHHILYQKSIMLIDMTEKKSSW